MSGWTTRPDIDDGADEEERERRCLTRIEDDDLRALGVEVAEHWSGREWIIAAMRPDKPEAEPVALVHGRGRRRLLRELAAKVRAAQAEAGKGGDGG